MSIPIDFSIEGTQESRSVSGMTNKKSVVSSQSYSVIQNPVFLESGIIKSVQSIRPRNSLTDDSKLEIYPKCKNINSQAIVVAVVNCRSLKNKIPEFQHLIHSTECNVIIGTESWLTDDVSDNEIFPKSFTIYRKDRISRSGGGVYRAVKNHQSSRNRSRDQP